jgi:hypothetical protein
MLRSAGIRHAPCDNNGTAPDAEENRFDLGLRRSGIAICAWCSGIAGFVGTGADGSARRHPGAGLLWSWLSPRPLRLLRSQRRVLWISPAATARGGGRAACLPVGLLHGPIRPLLPILN